MENISNDIESEIIELNRQLEEKKKQLEAQSGIVEEKEALAEVVSEHIYGSTASGVTDDEDDSNSDDKVKTDIPTKRSNKTGGCYLDTLSSEEASRINTYILSVPANGIKKTINQVKNEDPLLIDAFHDALVTKLYDELKSRGLIK